MKGKYITLLLIILCAAQDAIARDRDSKENTYQHSIEITTGYPSLIFDLEFPWLNETVTYYEANGKLIKTHFQPGLNIGYTFAWSKRWEVNAMANIHLTSFDVIQYPALPGMESAEPSHDNYDWNAAPVSKERETDVYGAVCASVRYKWIVRESFSMYSALGAGVSFAFPIPLPYVAPVGIQFGKGRVYGIAELNVSAANTFGMVGIGIRLN